MENDITQTTTTNLAGGVSNFSTTPQEIEQGQGAHEISWDNSKWPDYHGLYRQIPELKKAIDRLRTWTVGKGWTTETSYSKTILDHIRGNGKESFSQVIGNLLVVCLINGDAYAEIIEGDDKNKTLINLKVLTPSRIKVIFNPEGMIERYEELDLERKKTIRTFEPDKIFHLINDKVASEIHGVSVIEACQWIIEARNEAMRDWRRISHRSTIRILYIAMDDKNKFSQAKTDYKDAIENGELLILPVLPNQAEIRDLTLPPHAAFLEWIRYLENVFYQVIGVPRVIATSENFTEASSKVGYMTFEPIYTEEQTDLEDQIWNQLGLRVKFNRPPTLTSTMQEDEEKNTGQTSIQPNEMSVGMGRTE